MTETSPGDRFVESEDNRLVRWFARTGQWLIVVAAGLAALVLGLVGFREFHAATGEAHSWWDDLYLTLQLFMLESGSVNGPVPWKLEVARLLAPAVAAFTAFQALAVIFREEFEQLRIRFSKNHVLICGLGRKGSLLARSLRERGDRVVVIERDADNDLIDVTRGSGALVLIGDARTRPILRKARAGRSRHVIAVCGVDGVNAEIAVRTRDLASKRKGRALSCLVHIVDPELCTLLRMQEIERRKTASFRLDFFNVYETGARKLLTERPPWRQDVPAPASPPRMIVVGLGQLGESLVAQAATIWKAVAAAGDSRLRVTIVDQRAAVATESMSLRHPWIETVCEVTPLTMSTDTPEFQRAGFLCDKEGRFDTDAIYVCLDDDSAGLSAALALNHHLAGRGVVTVVRMSQETGLASLIREEEGGPDQFTALLAFGLLNRTCQPDLLFEGIHERLARAFHEDFRQQRLAEGETPETYPSIAAWEQLAERYRESNREAAAHIGVKLAIVGCELAPLKHAHPEPFHFTEDELDLLARIEHERWLEERQRDGWTHGKVRHEKKKIHPQLKPWSQLEKDTRGKDRRFVVKMIDFLADAGFRIIRLRTGQARS